MEDMGMIRREDFPATFCSTDYAAEYLGVTRSRIRQLMAAGQLTAYPRRRTAERAVFVDGAELKQLKEAASTGRPRGGKQLN
jgi:excisionase family DNA binding protein